MLSCSGWVRTAPTVYKHTQYFNNEALSVSHTALCHCLQISMHLHTYTNGHVFSPFVCVFGCLVHQARVLSPCSVWDIVFTPASFRVFLMYFSHSFSAYMKMGNMLGSTPNQSLRDHLNEIGLCLIKNKLWSSSVRILCVCWCFV